jgi:kinesin family protein 3/17
MIGMISPAECSFSESLSTLNFAKRAKSIKNRAIVNEDIDHNALIRQYENELKKLRRELEEKDRLLRDNNFIMELEEQKKEAERDKNEAIQALEEASIKYLQERDEKKKLENKIQLMNFQMIPGGQKISIEETPQFQDLLQKHQILLEKDFQEKLDEIEQEREALAASKEQVDSYNKLLSRQRNIMVGLTTSLNERDENIAQLQEEIEAYEKMSKDMEENIKIKDKRILLLEDLLRKNNIEIPEREKEEEIEKVVSKKNEENKIKNLNVKKPKLYMKYIDDNLGIDDENNEKKK